MKHPLMRQVNLLLVLVLVLLSATPFVSAQEVPPVLGSDPRINEAGLALGVFATGLNFPMGMVELPDGSLLVATSDPTGGSFFQSTGELLRLTDADGDGVSDDEGTILATGLAGPLVAIQRAGDLIFVTGVRYGEEGIFILRRGETWESALLSVGKFDVRNPGSEHQTYGLSVREHPDDTGTFDLLFNVGAYGNVRAGGNRVTLGGLASGFLEDASIYLITGRDTGDTVLFGDPVKVGGQLRNASTFVFDRESGDLVIGENGMDTPGNEIVSLAADEIDVIPAADIGVNVLEFGFPESYVDYATGDQIGSGGVAPVLSFEPMDGSESEGIASLVQLPEAFPEPFAGGYAAGFHGQFDETGDANEENPLVFFDLETGERFELIANDNPGVGHLDSLLSTADSIFIADLCATGSLVEATPCGVIYRLTVNS